MDYTTVCQQLLGLVQGVPHTISNLANASALLWQELADINWVGFYILDGNCLVLGPFQGKPACIEIPVGKGVCGTAAAEGKTQLVPDVHQFPGHIACDSASNSELVIPIYKNGTLFGVLDIDSPKLNRFAETDKRELEKFAGILQENL